MRRLRLRTTPGVLFGAMLATALVVFLPLRLALGLAGVGDAGLSAARVGGTLWGGSLTDAHLGEVALGDLKAHLSPWPLLIGRARIELDGRDPARPLEGAVTLSRHRTGLDDATATLPTGRLFAPLPVTTLALEGVSAHFRDGACEDATGRVRVTLAGEAGGVPLPGSLAGAPRCDGAALLLPLASAAGTEAVQLRIEAAGTYTARFVLRPSDGVAAQRLEAAGFSPSPQGHVLQVQGSL